MIEVIHNGHTITYSENKDVWRCFALNVEGNTLSAIKAKINKVEAVARRCNVPIIVVRDYGNPVSVIGTATLLDGEQVWITYKGNKEMRREKVKLSTVVLDTPENREALMAVKEQQEAADAAAKTARTMLAAIPRASADDLKSLTPKPDTIIE